MILFSILEKTAYQKNSGKQKHDAQIKGLVFIHRSLAQQSGKTETGECKRQE